MNVEGPGRAADVRLPEWLPLVLVALGVVAVHAAALRQPFFADDYLFLEQVRGRSLGAALAAPDPLGNFFRPVGRALHFWWLARLGGESPALFHAVNLGLFLAGLLAFHAVAKRLAGRAAALFAFAFVAFHYAADVPLRWASGSQDLLAILFANLAVLLQVKGRRAPAAVSLLLALLSKEVVAGAALVAIVAARAPGERWRDTLRRQAALPAVTLLWAIAWLASLARRPLAGEALSLDAGGLAAALVHLAQVVPALEFRLGGQALGHVSALALLPAACAALAAVLAFAREREPGGPAAPTGGRAIAVGATWTLVAVAPLALVMPIWSAYFYLWAMCGVGLLLARLSLSLPRAARVALLAALVFLSASARGLDEFAAARGAWAWQSHVNRHYVDRALRTIRDYLAAMRAARPVLPRNSTVFFAGVPVSSGWQAADGPLLRWAYRDTTLRSYFLGQFTLERAERGPVFFFAVERDSLVDRTDDPALLRSFAFSMLLAERPGAALDALELVRRRAPADAALLYWSAWARWGAGDTLGAARDLAAAGHEPGRALPAGARERFESAGTDTAARLAMLEELAARAATSAWVHARLAALHLAAGDAVQGALEAYAYHVLAPDDAEAWRKWAAAQLAAQQYEPALRSLERYFALAGERGRADREAQLAAESLRRVLRGDVAQRALR